MIGFILFGPAKLAARLTLDLLFGKPEPFEYPLTGTSGRR